MTPPIKNSKAGTAAVILLAFLLFYLPTMLAILSHDKEPNVIMKLNVLMATCYTGIFCINYLVIVPKIFMERENKVMFFLINFCLVVGLCSLIPIWFELAGGLPRPRHMENTQWTSGQVFMGYFRFIIRDLIMMILSIALAYAMRLSKAREEMRSRVLELEAERRNTELMNLKAQLNPHFLFNSLNNIYALIAIDADKAQQSLHELSNMLRFMIYDSESKSVPLAKEMQFINDYTLLMSLRLNPSIRLTCTLPDIHDNSLQIAPLLIMTLVENAFKHVGVVDGKGFISISISVEDEKFKCRVENTFIREKPDGMEKGASGVGLKNIEKQLQLLYPNFYQLTIKKNKDVFYSELTILTAALR